MRHLDIAIPARWFISEAKVRIDHPEDLVFDEGSAGARRALNAMLQAAATPHMVTIKWDGSPALIFGRDDEGFTITDKSGFNSKKAGGLPRNAGELKTMLWMRKPNDPTRENYANSIASLWSPISRILPPSFRGFLQAHLLWNGRPTVVDGNYVFRPNKITYSIPTDSPLGNKINNSTIGLAVHSRLGSQDDQDSKAIGSIESIGLIPVDDVVIMGPEIKDLEHTHLPDKLRTNMQSLIKKSASKIDGFLNASELSRNQISDLPAKLKQYGAYRAGMGVSGFGDAANGFLNWLDTSANITERKKEHIKKWIKEHEVGYIYTWAVADQLTKLKDYIRHDVDRQVGTSIRAALRDQPGHEGYVADTPSGKIKFVDRPTFMRKDSKDAVS